MVRKKEENTEPKESILKENRAVDVRDVLSPMDLLFVVGILKRFLGRNTDIRKFLEKIDEPQELEKLYDAIGTLVSLVD